MDQNVEVKAWEERLEYKKKLSKAWKIPSSILSKYYKHSHGKENHPTNDPKKVKTMGAVDFRRLPVSAHSVRNLKLLILTEITALKRFTPSELLAREDLHLAARCVAIHDHRGAITEREVNATFLAACNLLVRDGNIIVVDSDTSCSDEVTFIVVGKWNLGTMIRGVASRDGRVVVRELWQKIMAWGSGWQGTTKGVIGSIVEEVLMDLKGEEWVESKAGVWTRIDDD